MRVGVHVSIAGGWLAALERAVGLSCRSVQIFSRSPRGGPAPRIDPQQADAFAAGRQQADLAPLIVHGPYIINLASADRTNFSRSAALCRDEYARCVALGARYLVLHVGSHKGDGEEQGIARVAEAVNRILDQPARGPHLAEPVMVLLENTAGSGQGLGYRFEQLTAMRALVEDQARIGFCLDTAHLFASGFPIHTAEGLTQTMDDAERILGMARVRVIHLNDSKSAFESRVDRHWHIGEGQIGMEAMGRILREPRLADLPLILETPKDSDEDDRRNLATVHRLLADRPAETAGAGARRSRRNA